MDGDAFIRLRDVSKRFGGVQAVDRVSLEIEAGTVLGLVGENGAGKSTLGRILAGVISRDGGDLLIEGHPVAYKSPRNALADGIAIISQEIALVPKLTVAENVFMGSGGRRAWNRRVLEERYARLEETARLGVPGDVTVESLSVAEQQKVEILRAISREARLIVFDEPTSSLSQEEAKRLHALVRQLREEGITIIYVTHFLEEILALANRITVLRNGRVVETVDSADATVNSLIQGMLGRDLSTTFPARVPLPADAPVRLVVDDLSREGAIESVSFEIRRGEIVGLAGLVGSGRSEVARAIFGADRIDSGTVELDGETLDLRSPRAAVEAGIAFAPEDRKGEGLLMDLSQRSNMTLPHLPWLSKRGIPSRRTEREWTGRLLERLNVSPAAPDRPVRSLSGGNQQKVLIGKWLLRDPRLIILDEPTRGVDIGAKHAVYKLIAELAEQGLAVLLISSELEEILGLAHRVLVLREGRVGATLSAAQMSKEAVIHAAFGLDADIENSIGGQV
jgi:ABC-type sugar transport system ATPase subunit